MCAAVGGNPDSGPVEDDQTGRRDDAVDLAGPSPAQARRAVATLAADAELDAEATSGLLLAVSEIVTNAHLHGRPPVRVRMWRTEGAVTVAVHDAGTGPERPPADELPAPDAVEGGRGCWLARQAVARYETRLDGSGYEVRLTAGSDHG